MQAVMQRQDAILCRFSTQLMQQVPDELWWKLGLREALESLSGPFHYALTVASCLRDDASDLTHAITHELFNPVMMQTHKVLTSQPVAQLTMSCAFWHVVQSVRGNMDATPVYTMSKTKTNIVGRELVDETTNRLAYILTSPAQPGAATWLAVRKTLLTLGVGALVAKGQGWGEQPTLQEDLATMTAYVYAFAEIGEMLQFNVARELATNSRVADVVLLLLSIIRNPNFGYAATALKKALQLALTEVHIDD